MKARSIARRAPHQHRDPDRVRSMPVPTAAFRLPAAIGAAPAPARPKTARARNPHLLAMVRGRPCLLLVPGICVGGTDTTVPCHSNLIRHGKGLARKANDQYHVPGCVACHRWLDQGPAPAENKLATFMRAHADQVLHWRAVLADMSLPQRDRDAVRWALDLLNATPVVLFTP